MNLESIKKIYLVPKIKLKLGHTSDEVQNRLLTRRVKILEYIRLNGKVKLVDIAKDLNVIKQTVINDIDALVDVHSIVKVKKCKGNKYTTVEYCIRYTGIYC